MANPQKENGFVSIANELLERICCAPISGSELRVLLFTIRKTYGFGKKLDWISLSQYEAGTGLPRANVCKTLKSLVVKRLLYKEGNRYGINKNYSQWLVVKRLPPVVKRPTQVVVKRLHTKETITKEIRGASPSLKEMKKNRMGSYREDAPQDSYDEAIDIDTGEKVKAKRAAPNKEIEMAIAWAEKLRGKPFMNPAQQERAMRVLIKNKVPAQKIKDKWYELMVIPAFRDKGIDFWTIVNQLDKSV